MRDHRLALVTKLGKRLAPLALAIDGGLALAAVIKIVLTDIGHHAETQMVAGVIVDQKVIFAFSGTKPTADRLERGHKPGWVGHKYRERFGVWPNDPRVRSAIARPPSLKTKNWIVSRRITFAKAREVDAHG
jgi:hypothetical protein